MIETDTAAAQTLWAAYRTASDADVPEELPPVDTFGDSPELADELIAFVVDGPKRATAGLVAEFEAADEELPRVGDHWIACDGSGTPRVVLRTAEVRIGPLISVDEQFAWDEGEYDRTLESWLRGHRAFFRCSCERLGIDFSDDIEVMFERFQVVWPPERSGLDQPISAPPHLSG